MAVKELERKSGDRRTEPIKGEKLTYTKNAVNGGRQYGLPEHIEGNPLGCGCSEAYLAGMGTISRNGEIEADYMCSSGWHNYVLFQLNTREMERSVRLDKFGNVVESEGFKSAGLEEY